MKKKIFPVLCLTFGLLQAAFGQIDRMPAKPAVDSEEPQLVRGGYLIGPGDVITGRVLGEPQFDFTATIGEDGKFQVPFFDKSLMAKCKTDKELRVEVIKLLSKYLKNPQITVSVSEGKSRPLTSVFGEVRAPQNIDMRRKAKLLEMISLAGGLSEEAGSTVQVFRTQPPMCSETNEDTDFGTAVNTDSGVPTRTYDLVSVKKGLKSANPVIIPGDIIVVQKSAPVYIIGQIVTPGGIRLPERGLSLTTAIAMVGGVNSQAKTKDIRIFRLKPNSTDVENRDIISVNFDSIKKGREKDILLQPYDIVEVDKTKKSVAQIVLETVVGVGRTAATTAGGGITNRILY